jgi:hypothetical protein
MVMTRTFFKTIVILFLLIIPKSVPAASQKDLPDLALQAVSKSHSEIINKSKHSWKIHVGGETPIINQSIRIEVLEGVTQNPILCSSTHVDFSSLSAIVGDITSPEMTEEEKAKALWRFTMNNLYSGRWSTGADGLEHLNVYGYGYCGTFTALLEPLWWAAGLSARHVNIGNHAATEVYYDNDWHYLDAHRRCFFLEKDNRTIASLEDLNYLPALWDMKRRKKTEQVGQKKYYYMTMHPRDHGTYSREFPMSKGDRLTLSWNKSGKWCLARGGKAANKPAPEPAIYANGTFDFVRDLRKPLRADVALISSKNINWEDSSLGYVHPLKAKEDAHLVYKVRVPYFIPEALVTGRVFRQSPKDLVAIDISTDNGGRWLPHWRASGTGMVEAEFSTSKTQAVTARVPWKYSYLIRIRMRAEESPLNVGAYFLKSTAHLVYNPVSLPALNAGENIVTYSNESDSPYSVKVTYHWLENLPIRISRENPLEGEEVTVTALVTNLGAGSARNIPVVVYSGEPQKGGVEIGRDIITNIEAGAAVRVSVRWKATRRSVARKKNLRTEGAGIYISVDPDNSVRESDESNNIYLRTIKVLHPPEVSIPSESFIKFEKKKENPDVLTIAATVRNLSRSGRYGFYLNDHAEATGVLVKFFDGKPGRKNQIGSNVIIDRLKPLEFRNVSVDWNVSKLKGKRTIYVQAFPGKNVTKALGHKRLSEASITIDLDKYRSSMAEK